MTRAHAITVLSAALLVAVVGLALLWVLMAIHADAVAAHIAASALGGRMQVSTVFDAMSASGNAAHAYLSK